MAEKRSLKDYLLISAKGLGMGAADVVPGVSGGTIAFITGIYEELLTSISNINLNALKILRKEGIAAAWKHLNGWFFVSLLGGIAISIASLAKLITYLMEHEAIALWSFFLGLVAASIFYVGKQVKEWNVSKVIGLIIGAVVAFSVTVLPPLGQSDQSWFIFVSGMIAICAMILPGISGSFILLLLGSYSTVITSIKEVKIVTLGLFAAGCIVGLLSFSRVLKWLFEKYESLTIAILTGFLIGSLNKLWPWKKNVELLYIHSDGKEDWLQTNVLPADFVGDPMIASAIGFAVFGFGLIFGMEALAKRLGASKKQP